MLNSEHTYRYKINREHVDMHVELFCNQDKIWSFSHYVFFLSENVFISVHVLKKKSRYLPMSAKTSRINSKVSCYKLSSFVPPIQVLHIYTVQELISSD